MKFYENTANKILDFWQPIQSACSLTWTTSNGHKVGRVDDEVHTYIRFMRDKTRMGGAFATRRRISAPAFVWENKPLFHLLSETATPRKTVDAGCSAASIPQRDITEEDSRTTPRTTQPGARGWTVKAFVWRQIRRWVCEISWNVFSNFVFSKDLLEDL